MTKNKGMLLSIGLLILLVISIGAGFYYHDQAIKQIDIESRQNQQNIDFFNDYVVAVNDYHVADSYFDLANVNLDNGIWYSGTEGYYYEFAIDYLEIARGQLTDAKELLAHSKVRLESIRDKAPNQFYKDEVQNRIEQNEIMFSIINKYYSLVDYMDKQLYEVNYGSEAEATRYFNMYNELIVESNEDLASLSDISQGIDLAWDQDWYVLFEGI